MPASSIKVITAPTQTLLTTLERVKMELGIVNNLSDDILSAKLAEASSILGELIVPALGVRTVEESFLHYGGRNFNTNTLRLKYFPVVSITFINVDASVWPSTYYTFNPANGIITLADPGLYSYSFHFDDSLVVKYVAGYSLPGAANYTLPKAIESATIDLISWLRSNQGRDLSLSSEENVGVARFVYNTGQQMVQGIPAPIYAKIEKYTVL